LLPILAYGGGGGTRPLPRNEGEPKVKNGRSTAEVGAPERLGCGTVKEEVSQILQRVSARRCVKNSPFVLSCLGDRTKEAVTVAAKLRQFTAG